MVFLYLLSGLLFLVQARYRTPAVPYLCLFAAASLWTLKELFRQKRVMSLAAATAIGGGFLALAHFPFRHEIQKVDQWQQATKLHYQASARPLFQMGKYEEAVSALNQSVTMVPDFSPAYNLRGKSLAILGRHDEALADFERVISLSPNLSEGYRNAGFLYLLQSDEESAARYLKKAHALAPDDEKVKEALSRLK
jgi:tetratricopeptide (TPR) repeat protein